MATPVFDTETGADSAPSNAGITLPLPAGDPTGKLLVAILAEWTVGTPDAPPGWIGPYGSSGLWLFIKVGELADSGGDVTFTAWSPEVILTDSTGVVLVYDNAVGVDVISATATASGQQGTAPSVRTKATDTVVLEVFAHRPFHPSGASVTNDFGDLPAADRVDYHPDWTGSAPLKPYLAVTEQTRHAAGKTGHKTASVIPGGDWKALTVSLRDHQPPYIPIPLAPADRSVVDLTQDNDLTWLYGNVDPTNIQLGYNIELVDLDDETTTTPSGVTDLAKYTIPAGTLIEGHTYQWRVAVADAAGAGVSGYSAARTFDARTPPPAPVIHHPTGAELTIAAPDIVVHAGQASGHNPAAWQVRRVADDGHGTPDTDLVFFDSGDIAGDGTPSLAYPLTFDVTGRDEHLQVRYTVYGAPVWSDWTDVTVTVDFITPPVADVTVAVDQTHGKLNVAYEVPAPTGDDPAAVSAAIYRTEDGGATSIRVAKQLPTTGVWAFWTPASDRDYWFQIVAAADDGAVSYSDWTAPTLIDADDDFDYILDGGSA